MQRTVADDEMEKRIEEVDLTDLFRMIQQAREEFIIQVEMVIAER